MMHRPLLRSLMLMLLVGFPAFGAEGELQRRATWETPPATETHLAVDTWLQTLQLAPEVSTQLQQLWSSSDVEEASVLLDRLVQTTAAVDPRAAALADVFAKPPESLKRFDDALLRDEALPELVRDNLQLAYGIWLAKYQLYDEAQTQLSSLQPEQVVDPASLLFYQGVAHYRLREKELGLKTLDRLLEREDSIPVRFAIVARLMHTELEAFKPDSLDDVARLMDSITVRLGHGRAGKRVRQEEDEVIEKLDKMIEELEKQRQQMQQQASNNGGAQGSAPMQDSTLPGMQAEGNVNSKKVDGPIDWGNLPPAERQEALQQLGKQFPSHYREVIEEYFRDLARKEIDSEKP